MSNDQPSFSRLFNAPTDVPAILVIVLGLAIALFLGDLPVRLIGVCIALLGTIGVVVLYNQRTKDLSALRESALRENALREQMKPSPKASEVSDFKTTMKQDGSSKRLVFDDFAESFGVATDDSTQALPKAESKPVAPQTLPKADTPQSTPKATPTALPKKLVFDDFSDDAAGFDDVNEVTLVTAPHKFTPETPPPTLPTPQSAVRQTLDEASGKTSEQSASGKKVLVFDDSDENVSLHNDFTPQVAIGHTSLPSDLQPKPAPPPATPPPPPVTIAEPIPGNYNAPKLDESLLHADFDDDDAEFRIVGKSVAAAPAPTTIATAQVPSAPTSVSQPTAHEKKKDESPSVNPGLTTAESGAAESEVLAKAVEKAIADAATAQEQSPAEKLAREMAGENKQEVAAPMLEELTTSEDIQDKVTRAAKAAVIREQYEAPSPTATAETAKIQAKAPANQASTALPEEAVSHRRKKLTVQMEEIVEETPESAKNEPRREFEFLLQRVLLAIRSAMSARTTAYWWYAADRKQLTLESKISDMPEAMHKRSSFPLGNDALSHIAENGAPEILTEISSDAELQLLPYYASSANTRSFVGVPVFFNSAVVGVITADSTEDDAYDNATVSFLGHFTKLVSGLIQSYTEKYDLLQSARTLDAIDTFRQLTLKPDRTGEDVCTALIRALMRLVPYTTIGTCMYSEERGGWYVSNLHTKESATKEILGGEVYLDNSLVGKTITNGRTYRFANPAANFIRVTQREQKPSMLAFTGVPLVSVSRCYGALFIEETGETRLTKQDVEIIETVCEYAGTALEQMQLQDYVQTHALLQEASDNALVSTVTFLQRVKEELARAEDVELSLTIALVSLDKYASFSNNPVLLDELTQAFVQILRKNLRPYDVVARYHGTTLAVCLIEKNTQAAQMWAERIRRETAAASLNVGGKQYNVTVSIGLAEFLKQANIEELMAHAEKAMDAALKKTNSVSIFS
jgi:diguanylate cyclase (GGDEF)-like protein